MAFLQLITTVGLAKIANALAGGYPLEITEVAVGDVATLPDVAAVALGNEVWRGAVNSVEVAPGTTDKVRVEATIPVGDGGWTMREAGAFDSEGDLILVALIPETYKPDPGVDGASVAAYIRLNVAIANAADALTLTADPSVVLATRLYVDEDTIGSKLYAFSHFS